MAMGGMATPSGGRPPSGAFRPPTGAAGGLGGGAGVGVLGMGVGGGGAGSVGEVSVAVRPVTAAGLSGASTGRSLGPSRQVADRSYWQVELRGRLQAMTAEAERLQAESAAIAQENTAYAALERRYDGVMKEVRALEGELADHNLALDKLRTRTSVDELKALHSRLSSSNAALRAEADDLFLSAGQQRAVKAELEGAMGRIEAEAAKAVRLLGEDRAAEFDELQGERAAWRQRRAAKLERLSAVQLHIGRCQAYQQSPECARKVHAAALSASLSTLSGRMADLSSDLSLSSDPAALKEKLTSAIKQVNEEVQQLDSRRRAVEEELEQLQSARQELEADRDDAADALSKRSKYAAIAERERKMSDVIRDYPRLQAELQQRLLQVERQVVASLSAVSAERAKASSMGDAVALSELSAEVSFKQNKVRASEETMATLRMERERRLEELDKVAHLDGKIQAELSSLKGQMRAWREDMGTFQNEDGWKVQHTLRKQQLTQRNAQLSRDMAALQGATQEATAALTARQQSVVAQLQSSGLPQKEGKWQSLAGEVAELEQFVSVRKKETEYSAVRDATLQLIQRINSKLLAAPQLTSADAGRGGAQLA